MCRGTPVSLCGRVYTQEGASACMCTCVWVVCGCVCSRVRMAMRVCMNELYVSVSRRQSRASRPHSSETKHAFLRYTFSIRKGNSHWYFFLTLSSAEIFCVHCFNWIKKRCVPESSILRSKSLPGKWKWKGLGVVISFMYETADRPGGGEGGETKHVTEIILSCIDHLSSKNLKAHLGIFYPIFPYISEAYSISLLI